MPQAERSIPELTKDMAFHLGDMFRNELKLARVEATEGVKSLGGVVGKIAAGAVVGVSALTVALMAVAFALSEMMPMWAASAIVAVLAGIVAWMLIKAGQSALKSHDLSLSRTREQVSRDIKTISERVH
ncbi:MAG TPA: phage holin family protein [Hyphomonadaceae bacterium]|nr:phage holin family protein [Hyphomonadaceae bacterium]